MRLTMPEAMDDAGIPVALLEVFRREFEQPGLELSPWMGPQDISGWDSVRMVNLIFATEEAFGMQFTAAEMERLACVADFIRCVAPTGT